MPDSPAPTTTTSTWAGRGRVASLMPSSLRLPRASDLTQHDSYLILGDMSVIRSAGLRGFRDVVTDLGGDPLELARQARLDPAALDADDVLVPDVAVAGVLEIAAV